MRRDISTFSNETYYTGAAAVFERFLSPMSPTLSSDKFALIYIACPSEAAAAHIGNAAITMQLAASANLLPGMKSIYRWRGKIETATETVLLLKTMEKRVDSLVALIRAQHPYEVPAILILPIIPGHPSVADWLTQGCAAMSAPS